MKPSVKGWSVAAQQKELKVQMQAESGYDFTDRKRRLGYTYTEEADSKKEKKSVIAQIMFFADRELCHE